MNFKSCLLLVIVLVSIQTQFLSKSQVYRKYYIQDGVLYAHQRNNPNISNSQLSEFLQNIRKIEADYHTLDIDISNSVLDMVVDFSDVQVPAHVTKFRIDLSVNIIKEIKNLSALHAQELKLNLSQVKGNKDSLTGLTELQDFMLKRPERKLRKLTLDLHWTSSELFLNAFDLNDIHNLEELNLNLRETGITTTKQRFFEFQAHGNFRVLNVDLSDNKQLTDLYILNNMSFLLDKVSINVENCGLKNLDDLFETQVLQFLLTGDIELNLSQNPLETLNGLSILTQITALRSVSLKLERITTLSKNSFTVLGFFRVLPNLKNFNISLLETENRDNTTIRDIQSWKQMEVNVRLEERKSIIQEFNL